MDWLNYHHLFYFWTVVREGSIAAACRKLLLSPATISAQLRELEQALGEKLFRRVGRNLAPTEFGRLAARYADEIFGLGREFLDVARGHTQATSVRFRLGVDDVLPKLMVARVVEAVFHLPQPIRLVCVEGTQAQLLPQLAVHELDLVLTHAPPDPAVKVRTYAHLLGESGIRICAVARLARNLRRGFPAALDGAPALLPTPNTSLRRAMDAWFESVGVRPRIVAEFEDRALLNACGYHGAGFFAVPEAVADEITRRESVQTVGRMGATRERLYALSVDRRVKHPAAVALVENAAALLGRPWAPRSTEGQSPGAIAGRAAARASRSHA